MESFIIKDKDKLVKYYTLATYHDNDTLKDYIVYTDYLFNSNGKLNVYYSLYEIEDNNIKLIDIKDNKDKEIGLLLTKEILKDLKN